MLLTARQVDEQTAMEMLLKGVAAYDPDTGAYLTASDGRSRYAPKWFLFYADSDRDGEWRPYGEWRTIFRAWSFEEALMLANQKLARLVAKGRAHVTAKMSVRGGERDPLTLGNRPQIKF